MALRENWRVRMELRRCVEDLIDLGDQIAQMKRLRQDFGVSVGAGFLGVQGDGGKTSDEQDFHGRQMLGRALGKFDPVDAGHHDIRQQQVITTGFKRGQGLVAIAARCHQMARPAQCVRKENAEGIVVLS